MNYWLERSIEYALSGITWTTFSRCPTIPEGLREIDEASWAEVEAAFEDRDNQRLIRSLLRDGVLYIKGRSKMYRQITTTLSEQNIVSALVLREFLYSV